MSLNLTAQEENEIWKEAEQQCPPVVSIDRLETIYSVPALLGSGYLRKIALSPDLDLCIYNETYNDLTIWEPEHQHLVQFMVSLSGVINNTSHSILTNSEQSYVGGSGIQRSSQVSMFQSQTQIGVNIHMKPHLLRQCFATPTGELPAELQPLVREGDWHQAFVTKTTGSMRSVVQQIIDCSLVGPTKRLYLQGKVFELMALQLDTILESKDSATSTSPKPDTIARIHHAAEIMRSQLEHPPSQVELAQRVGVSYCTLHRGFRTVFGATPFTYLTQQRMKQAEHLLRQSNCTVTEAANRVGYTNPAKFAAAFKRQFGISPSDCIRGRKTAR
jgi:AraC-like DNA-binding protein